jgi:hypothetical protein
MELEKINTPTPTDATNKIDATDTTNLIDEEDFEVLEASNNYAIHFENKYMCFFIDKIREREVFILSKQFSNLFNIINCHYLEG